MSAPSAKRPSEPARRWRPTVDCHVGRKLRIAAAGRVGGAGPSAGHCGHSPLVFKTVLELFDGPTSWDNLLNRALKALAKYLTVTLIIAITGIFLAILGAGFDGTHAAWRAVSLGGIIVVAFSPLISTAVMWDMRGNRGMPKEIAANPSSPSVDGIARSAVSCNICFNRGLCKRSIVDRAQPRYIGAAYHALKPRVALVMLNPGSGDYRSDSADRKFKKLLDAYAMGRAGLERVFEHQRFDIPRWGRGRFLSFIEASGLKLDDIALANIAWCGTSGNRYPQEMLSTCFERYTGPLLEILSPDLVVLAGDPAHKFANKVQLRAPRAVIVCAPHYAHRKGRAATEAAAQGIREQVSRLG